ncbi:HAD-IA family hydrolase [Fervidibacillus halotolerans]|uniref:HAD-IA family hydrolase n=1 Tax=Fervidibacillus halotolerans TaxID=2980027 RepID=A0A9E8RYQ6_9BACI|nr:HAD-IA family hydrolase [Fervidibacillus halotolerans]WAA12513.1 HAD-IA family hydrolase [Fervidibacillus halotolerans]
MVIANKPDALIFDIDGTIFQTESILNDVYFLTFQSLKEKGYFHGDIPPIEKMYRCLGMILDEIWDKLLPGASQEARDYASKRMLELEMEALKNGNGNLYPGVRETLQTLHQRGYRLFVASNGLEDYVKGVVNYCGLEGLFEKVYSADEFQTTSKVDLVKLILENHGLKHAWMIGDRSSDVEAGKQNNLFVVGCDYATFKKDGELDGANLVINEMKELLTYL